MKYEPNKPVVRNRASVLTTDVEITFFEKHQVDEVFTFLVDKGYEFYFETEIGDSVTLDKHKLTVVNISWANNVTELFQFLEELDYNSGFTEKE
jgi:hypothetical protein